MAYKSVLTICTDAERAAITFAGAAKVALAQDGHLDALALGVDATQMSYAFVGTGEMLLPVIQERAQSEAKLVTAALKAAAKAESTTLRWSVESIVAMYGGLIDMVAQYARFADLMVVGQPYGENRTGADEAIVEAALFESRTPVLVLPDTPLADGPIGRRVVIAWNQSREAIAAVRSAMPFLKSAQMVDITVIDPPVHGPERSDPGGALCQMLVRHGVKAEVTVLAKTLPRVSDVLQQHVSDSGADLIVMGAYGHSRFRESILGGATRSLLEQAKVPVLMAH